MSGVILFLLSMVHIIMGVVAGVEDIIVDTLGVIRQVLKVMRSDEPVATAVLLLGHCFHNVLLIHLDRQIHWVRASDVLVNKLALVLNVTILLGRVKLLALLIFEEELRVLRKTIFLLRLFGFEKSLRLLLVFFVHQVGSGLLGVRVKGVVRAVDCAHRVVGSVAHGLLR